MLTGIHDMIGEWRISDKDQYIRLSRLMPYLRDKKPSLVNHNLICWKYMDDPDKKVDGLRYLNCDITVPGILVEYDNPGKKKYRMIDGSHRITKMLLETDLVESYFYIIPKKKFLELIEDY